MSANLHSLPADQLKREIEALRAKVAAISPPTSMLESHQRDRLQIRLFTLQDELTRRDHERFRGNRRTRKAVYSWHGRRPTRNSIAAKLNREAEKRLRFVLEIA